MKINLKKHLLVLLAIPALALSVSAVVAPSAFAVDDGTCDIESGLSGAAQCAKGKDQPTSLFADGGIFQIITNTLLFVIGAVSVVMMVIGGIRYTISQGDSTAVTSAKNTILYAIIGLVVAILAYAAVQFVIGAFVKAE